MGNAGTLFDKARREAFRDRLWSFYEYVLDKEDLSSGELDILKRSRSTQNSSVTPSEEVQTIEEAQSDVHDLLLSVTMQLFEDTLAVLSLGKMCKRHGHTYE